MKPHEAKMILDPAEPYNAKDENLFLQARSLGAAALSKWIPKSVVGGRCPSCRSRVVREFSFCPNCGQMLGWSK